jgi:adenylate kinase
MKRLTGRRTCSLTGKLLNVYFSPQQELDDCLSQGGALQQREDDNEKTIGNRLQVYARRHRWAWPSAACCRRCGVQRPIA